MAKVKRKAPKVRAGGNRAKAMKYLRGQTKYQPGQAKRGGKVAPGTKYASGAVVGPGGGSV